MAARGRSKDLVALVALLCAASYGTWLWMRSSLELGGGWTDGTQVWSSVRGERIRYAVWDDPVPLAGLEDEVASRPALSPDGRWLVFAVGERGLNADLYVAEMVAGVPSDVRPLWVLNGPRDELAPAFGPDALYFATDRTGTGDLDIWRADYAAGTFAPPEPLGRGVNTEADESDPWPLADGGLVFASDRARGARRDWDLFRALPSAPSEPSAATDESAGSAAPPPAATSAAFTVEPIDAWNTPFDERDPSLSPDERTVVFASDRQGSQGGFDLFRSFLEDGSWLAPLPLHGVNDVDSDRGPLLSRDGFSLFFDRTVGPDGAPELWRASSRELFHVPGPPVSWRELLILASLVLLALTAWLAKRWSALEILYKCFLISLIVHFLLLWLLRDVYPEAEPTTLPGPERTFKVRLAPASQTTPLEARERSGELQAQHLEASSPSPERLQVEAPQLAAAAPRAESNLDAPEAPRPSAPARPGAALEAPREVAVEARLENREAPLERQAESAPGLVVTARPIAERLPQGTPGAQPVRRADTAPAPPSRSTLQPVVSTRLEGPDAPREQDALPGARRLSSEDLGAPAEPTVEIATPSESLAGEPLAAVPALALPEARALAEGPSARPAEPVASPGRRDEPPPAWTPSGARPDAAGGARLALPEGPRLEAPRRREGALESVGEPSVGPSLPGLAVREPAAAPPPAPSAAEQGPRRFDPLAGLGPASSVSLPRPTPSDGAPAPRRLEERDGGAPKPLVAALPSAPLALAPPPEPAPEPIEDRPPRTQDSPYKNRFGDEKLRALEEFGGSQETERAVAHGLAYLASIQNPRGYWGSRRDYHDKYGDVRIGKTALCLLAFLGAGHTPRSGAEHAAISERAVDFLLSQLDPASGHFGDSAAYGHGIASYALAECYALTKDPVLERPLRLAIEHILANQSDRPDPRFLGGWGYYYNDGRSWQGDRWPRVSVTSWQVMALESARLGGLDVPESAFDDARKFLLAAWDERREAFRYDHDPSRLRSGYPILPASTPAALFALSLLGVPSERADLDAARRFVLARAPQDYSYSTEDDFVFQARGNLYFWYYATLAMFRTGGGSWRRWNSAMKDTLLPAQATDGSWQPISIYARYAGDDEGDRSYSTAMCVLTLEVYYRYFTPLLAVR